MKSRHSVAAATATTKYPFGFPVGFVAMLLLVWKNSVIESQAIAHSLTVCLRNMPRGLLTQDHRDISNKHRVWADELSASTLCW